MLSQVYVIKRNDIIFKRIFANALTNSEIVDFSYKIKNMAAKEKAKEKGHFDFINYRISYDMELNLDSIFMFITGLMDDYFRSIRTALDVFKTEFLKLIANNIKEIKLDSTKIKTLNNIIDKIHKDLRPKISLVGFSGVGKTTIKNLIKLDEIPLQHVPTIAGDIATIKIGNLFFNTFDFAGQDQYRYLWKGFIKESDAVLIITDSTPKSIEDSKFFLELRDKEAPYARVAIIGNKQDLPNAMSPETIQNVIGIKTYPMIANRKESREKMVRIIAEILDMDPESNPLLDPLFDEKQSKEVESFNDKKSPRNHQGEEQAVTPKNIKE